MRLDCFLYSQDGFDLDVLLNQIDLMKSLKLSFLFGDQIQKSNLLIILRIENYDKFKKEFDSSKVKSALILDYSGQETLKVVSLFKEINIPYYGITSDRLKVQPKILFGHPFISIDRWIFDSTKTFSKSPKILHIGNYKGIQSKDNIVNILTNKILNSSEEFLLYGSNWPNSIDRSCYKGPISVQNVSKEYSRHNLSIGVKHPFQRGKAISGRYWHAPLNGCQLIVEDKYLSKEIPGIIYFDFNKLNTTKFRQVIDKVNFINSSDVKREAKKFWEKSNNISIELIEKLFKDRRIKVGRINILKYVRLKLGNFTYLHLKDYKRMFQYVIKKSHWK